MLKESNKKYYQLYLDKEVSLEDIYDYIDYWHKSNMKMTLPHFLGMTILQYGYFVETGEIK